MAYNVRKQTEVTRYNTASDKQVHEVELRVEHAGDWSAWKSGTGFYRVCRVRCPVSGMFTWTFNNTCRRGQPALSKRAGHMRAALQSAAEQAFNEFDSIENRLG